MSGLFHDVAAAALPVAVALAALAAAARAVVWSRLDNPVAQRVAAQHLEALSTWCLVAVVTDVVALALAGEAGFGSLIVPVGAGVAALLLRPRAPRAEAAGAPVGPARREDVARPQTAAPAPVAPTAPAPAAASASAPGLWADDHPDDAATTRGGLWSRA